MSIVTLPIPAPHTPKGEQSCFRSKLAMWVAETSVLFYHEVDGQDKLKAASLPISMGLLGEQIDKLDALFPETFKIPRSPDGGSTTVTFSELLGRPELQTAFLRRIFGTRANELSKAPYFRGFTTCIHGVEVMLLWAVHRHDALRLACNGHS